MKRLIFGLLVAGLLPSDVDAEFLRIRQTIFGMD